MYEENALDPEVDHRSSESSVVVLPYQTELILGLRAEQVQLLEAWRRSLTPVFEESFETAHPVRPSTGAFLVPKLRFLAKIVALTYLTNRYTTGYIGRRRWRALRLAILPLLMWNALRIMFCDVRPVDWLLVIIEVLVLVIIGAEAVIDFIHWVRRRNERQTLNRLVDRAEELRNSIPRQTDDDAAKLAWAQGTRDWTIEARSFFRGYSSYTRRFFDYSGGSMMAYEENNRHAPASIIFEAINDFGYRLDHLHQIVQHRDRYLE